MKTIINLLIISSVIISLNAEEEDHSNTILLTETGIKNLRLETTVAEERDLERTVFAVGTVEEIPGKRWSVSSRISGRAVEVNAFYGDEVKKGDVLVKVESRQPGNPPPTISLVAPTDGIISESHALKGQPVEPDKDLLDISDRTEMWVVAQIPEQMARGIDIGTKAHIRFPALGDETVDSKLLRFGVKANREAGSIEGVFAVANPEGRLLPGMRAEFEIVVESRSGIVTVPADAVQGPPEAKVVYIKDYELPNAFKRIPVVVGDQGGGWVEIKEGLWPGDEVVTRGAYMLGFVGNASSMSLKEALDAAHGHEHNEDGSEITPEQKAAREAEKKDHHDHDHDHGEGIPMWMIVYASMTSLLTLVFGQLWWNSKRKQADA